MILINRRWEQSKMINERLWMEERRGRGEKAEKAEKKIWVGLSISRQLANRELSGHTRFGIVFGAL